VNDPVRILPFLLRKSSEGGGGDIDKPYETAGRWAGDRIVLIGDYDESDLYDEAFEKFRNITGQLVKDFNDFVGIDEFKLEYRPCLTHGSRLEDLLRK